MCNFVRTQLCGDHLHEIHTVRVDYVHARHIADFSASRVDFMTEPHIPERLKVNPLRDRRFANNDERKLYGLGDYRHKSEESCAAFVLDLIERCRDLELESVRRRQRCSSQALLTESFV